MFLTLNPRNGEPAAKNLDFVPRPNGAPHLLTRQDWLNATRVQFIQNYFPIRTAIVLQQLKDGGLYPAIEEPARSEARPPDHGPTTLSNPAMSGCTRVFSGGTWRWMIGIHSLKYFSWYVWKIS